MIQIRKSVFETNSSSIHAICISRKPPAKIPSRIEFFAGEYGWQNAQADPKDYLYTAIICCDSNKKDERLEKLKSILESHGVECVFDQPYTDDWCYIDHGYELEPLIDDLLSNEDKLLRYLFSSESIVFTGHDNQEIDYFPINCLYPKINGRYDDSQKKWGADPNPNHRPDLFEYYEKGN